uniref:pilin n=1 Tax=Pseudoalteromonas sp. 45-MNA-CIBAN-0466 TaxID=3140426 RepID=UPI003320A67A
VSECAITTVDTTLAAFNSNSKVGLDPTATNISSTYVESVTVGAAGVITTEIRGTSNSTLNGGNLKFTPTATNGSVSWK